MKNIERNKCLIDSFKFDYDEKVTMIEYSISKYRRYDR